MLTDTAQGWTLQVRSRSQNIFAEAGAELYQVDCCSYFLTKKPLQFKYFSQTQLTTWDKLFLTFLYIFYTGFWDQWRQLIFSCVLLQPQTRRESNLAPGLPLVANQNFLNWVRFVKRHYLKHTFMTLPLYIRKLSKTSHFSILVLSFLLIHTGANWL